MRNRPAIVFTLACLAAVLAGGFFFLWRDTDEQAIERQLNRLVQVAEKQEDEAPFYTLSQSREIMGFIAEDPEVHFGPPLPVLTDRSELGAAIAQVRQTLQTLLIRVVDRQITLAEDRQSAEMEVEAEATVSLQSEGGRDRRRFAVEWVKVDGEWLIRRVRLLKGEPLPSHDLPM